jgi:hypothetical protein
MKRIIWQAALVCTLTAIAWLGSGCDDAKDADLPSQPYHLVRTYPMDGTAEDVCVRGGYIAVSNGNYGALVLNAQRRDSIYKIYSYDITHDQAHCTHVTLGSNHLYLAAFTRPIDNFSSTYGIFDLSADSATYRMSGIQTNFSGPLAGFDMIDRPDTIIFWATDTSPANDIGLSRSSWERTTDSTVWQAYGSRCQLQPGRGMARNFSYRSDNTFAVANNEAGIFLVDPSTCTVLSEAETPGLAYDCAWYGNYIAVADQYSLIIMDATDIQHPVIISAITLSTGGSSTAHRLHEVAIDGHYACVGDDYDGVYIVDISNPRAPESVQLIRMHDVTAVSTDNGLLCITGQNDGLVIFER